MFILALAWCSISAGSPSSLRAAPVGYPSPTRGASSAGIADDRCATTPTGPTRKLRHRRSKLVTKLGSPRHRGLDLIATPEVRRQVLTGTIGYGKIHKALEDEDVELFACERGAWLRLGAARTDDEGEFALALEGNARLGVGMRDLYVSVVGDRSGARFLGYVAPAGTQLIVSDVDGTLTSSEKAFVKTAIAGAYTGAQPGAPAAFGVLAQRGYQPVYVSARGEQFTEATRAFLEAQGFPRGPILLARSVVTVPGSATVAFKTRAIDNLTRAGLVVAGGVGNRASDIAAYQAVGLPAGRIFIGTGEFAGELAGHLAAGRATGFATYDELVASHLRNLP
jgi:phosphatidate phosphatase PAH1